MTLLGGTLAVVAAILVVAIALSSSSSHSPPGQKQATADAKAVQTLLAGIPQTGARLGWPNAPTKMDYYGDLECPVCQQFTLTAVPPLIASDVRSHRLQITYHSLETATQDPNLFRTQQVASLAAGQQNLGWDYIELFYHEQGAEGSGYVTESFLRSLASQIQGLNLTRWQSDRNLPTLANVVATDQQNAIAGSFQATPTLVITGPRGAAQPIQGAVPYSQVEQAIRSVGG